MKETGGRCICVTLAAVGLMAGIARSASPFDDAAAYWSMADMRDNRGGHALEAKGAVTVGVPLDGAEREASLARGGDGRAARFEGGYLALANDTALKVSPKQWTVAIRMRDPQGTWLYPILGSYSDDKSVSVALRAVDVASRPMTDRNYVGSPLPTIEAWLSASGGPRAVPGRSLIEAVWGAKEPDGPRVNRIRRLQPKDTWPNPLEQDVMNAVMCVTFPVGLIGPTEWHDIVVAMTGPKLELWIDGVLVDEEYPIGETRPRAVPFLIGAGQEHGGLKSGFRGLVDHVALWDRALSPAEIAAVSGGAEQVRQRELAILGDESPSMQYFRPRGHNRKAGDCIPYWDEQSGTFRLFYLILRRNMHSKWDGGHGGLEIWQASTKDLKTWAHHPVTIPITEQWEAWNGTGGVAFHNGTYNWFYPTPHYDGTNNGIQRAVSKDGVTFVKTTPYPYMQGGDCEVFPDPDPNKKTVHMIKLGKVTGGALPALKDKALVCWVSPADLDQQGAGVLTVEGTGGQFDSLVLGELAPHRWMAGSDRHRRTQRDQSKNADETAKPGEWVQLAAVYAGNTVTLYRNGARYSEYQIEEPLNIAAGGRVILGLRHMAMRGEPAAHFRGAIADARVYNTALTAAQVAELRPHEAAGPMPLVWFDFKTGGSADLAGTLAPADLEEGAAIRDGALLLGGNKDCLVSGGRKTALAHLVSEDLKTWEELPEPLIVTDDSIVPNMCPHWFKWNDWYYFIGGVNGIFKARQPYGPWTQQLTGRLDSLAVPKTGAFAGNRRIFAGFLSDEGWGGNEVLRELVQDADGNLGTRFVKEMIPATREPLKVQDTVRVTATEKRGVFELPGIPRDYRLQLEIVPEAGAAAFGLALQADGAAGSGCELLFRPAERRVSFSKMGGSSGSMGNGPAIDAVKGLDKAFIVDIIVRHDILDAEIGGFRSIVTRFWNAGGDRIRLFSDKGAVTFRSIRISPLAETYKPYPGWTVPPAQMRHAGRAVSSSMVARSTCSTPARTPKTRKATRR